jgi:hypothetical protein
MRRIESFLRFLWDFVIGDDWRIAAGVVVALGLTAVVAESASAWWILPAAVGLLLAGSVWRAPREGLLPPTYQREGRRKRRLLEGIRKPTGKKD